MVNGLLSGRGSFPGVLAGIVSNRGRPVNALSLPGILLMDKGAVADRDCWIFAFGAIAVRNGAFLSGACLYPA